MSGDLGTDQGQTEQLPTRSHDFVDNNAESDTSTDSCSINRKNSTYENKPKTGREWLFYFINKMTNILKEIGLLLLAIFFTYAAFTNDPPRLTKSPVAYPFFPKGSVVTDWYRGQISQAYDKARESDLTFVMYYAPWDAKSQDIRQEFELSARYMQKLVSFSAVNCWQPGSECRSQYSKVYNWPVLIAYPSHGRGIVYNGPKTHPHMMRFLESAMKPIIRITDLTEWNLLIAKHEVVVLAIVDALPGSPDFGAIYSTAFHMLEKDPFQEVKFAIVTGPAYGEPLLKLHMWNETLIYPSDLPWKSSSLLNWIQENVHQITSWVTPLGSKSQMLSSYLQPGPSLILFTPRNPLALSVDYYDMLHEIGLQYYDCDDEVLIKPDTVRLARLGNYYNYEFLMNYCSKQQQENKKPHVTVTTAYWSNETCLPLTLTQEELYKTCRIEGENCKNCNAQCINYENLIPKTKSSSKLKQPKECKSSDYNVIQQGHFKTSMLSDVGDPKSPANLKQIARLYKCRMLQIAEKIERHVFSPSIVPTNELPPMPNIKSLGCEKNTSLTFIALDSLKYYHFAERLGIDIFQKKDKTAAAIVNEEMESHYVLEEDVTDASLRQFIHNFSHNSLPRAYYSTSVKFNTTHEYLEQFISSSKTEFAIQELHSHTFVSTVMEPGKAVVVLYYSRECSFCNGISYTFLESAKALTLVDSLKFVRINGDLNGLPWEYTMERYPTILFFPSDRKSESRAFPQNMPITVANLIGFVLTNLDPSLKLHAMWSLCNQTKFFDFQENCIASLRGEVLTIIGKTLREWRKSDIRTKSEVLYKLKQLRNLHLAFAYHQHNMHSIQKFMKRLRLKPNLKKHYDIYNKTETDLNKHNTKIEL